MQISTGSVRVLRQIYLMHRHDVRVSREALAACLGAPPAAIARAIAELSASGLLQNPRSLRLTFPGLAVAAAASPKAARKSSAPQHRAEPRPAPPRPVAPLAPIVKAVPRRVHPLHHLGLPLFSSSFTSTRSTGDTTPPPAR